MEKYIVEIRCVGLFNNEKNSINVEPIYDIIEIEKIEDINNKIYEKYSNYLDVIYFPVRAWKLGEEVFNPSYKHNLLHRSDIRYCDYNSYDCETCPNKPDFNRESFVGDTPCNWCPKNQFTCKK